MDGLDFVDKLAETARQSESAHIDITARVMQTIRARQPVVDLSPVLWCAGASAAVAVILLLLVLVGGGTLGIDQEVLYEIFLPFC